MNTKLIVVSGISYDPPEWLKTYEDICIKNFIENSGISYLSKDVDIIRPKKISVNPINYLGLIPRINLNELNDIIRLSMSMTFKRRLINKVRITNQYFYILIMCMTFLFNLIHCINTYARCIYITKSVNAKFIISDHIAYIGGIFPLIARKLGIPMYTNSYPYGIRIMRNLNFNLLTEIVQLKQKENYFYTNNEKPIDIYKVPYLQPIKNKYIKGNYNLKDYNYIFYCHSFSDAQNAYGWDGGFINILDWTIFTLDMLKLKKVIIKPHPNMYANLKASHKKVDATIYQLLKNKYSSKTKNFLFLDKPIHNLELINDLNKNCIAITHHGTMIDECGAMGLRIISSKVHPIYDLKQAKINTWANKSEYKKLLMSSVENLQKPNINYCRNIYHNFIKTPGTFSSKNHWKNKIALYFEKNRRNFEANPEDFVNHLLLLKQERYDLYDELISKISRVSVTEYSLI